MTKKRRIWLFAVLSGFVTFAIWHFVNAAFHRRLVSENFSLVRVGQSQQEVEELLGGPPGNYGTHVYGSRFMSAEGNCTPRGSIEKIWCDDTHRFEIFFDADGRVVGSYRRSGYSQSPMDFGDYGEIAGSAIRSLREKTGL